MVNLSLSLKIRISDISRSSCAATVIILNLHGDKILTSSDMYNHNILKLKLYAFNIPTQIKKNKPKQRNHRKHCSISYLSPKMSFLARSIASITTTRTILRCEFYNEIHKQNGFNTGRCSFQSKPGQIVKVNM